MEKAKMNGNNIQKDSYKMPVKAPEKPAKCEYLKGCDLSKGYKGMSMPKPATKK
jgi:hypothetical protein